MARAPCLHTNMKLYTLTGLYNASPDTRWLNRLIYVLWSVFYVSLLTNLTIVLTQSARGQRDLGGAEVFQQCFEVLVAIIVFIDLRVFLSRVHPLLGHMQRMFDKSYPDIQAKCQTAERRIVIYMSGFDLVFVDDSAGSCNMKSENLIEEVWKFPVLYDRSLERCRTKNVFSYHRH
ncbi:hypothetical protein M8J77_006829 [Diaphorina citri]|nr:hypothetical protein M8J77_006829 [Diaphorina citri]